MITGDLALIVLGCLVVMLVLVIPILDSIEKLSGFISLRWSCIAVILLIMVGVVIDFNHLSDSSRDIVLTGGLIVVGTFLVLRTAEKVLYNGWLKGVNLKGSITKGDIVIQGELKNEEKKENSSENISNEKKENNI